MTRLLLIDILDELCQRGNGDESVYAVSIDGNEYFIAGVVEEDDYIVLQLERDRDDQA